MNTGRKQAYLVVNLRESYGTCRECGTVDQELRPYGKDGKWICFACGMKDEEEARRQFEKILGGPKVTILDVRKGG
ncbi:MAG: hypothetical protein LBH01_01065 [Verrucomicrobiales bacterium]|jgi:hypothetical protein|nr:hypothetical protein [Verrucomicrobiales bacterium]